MEPTINFGDLLRTTPIDPQWGYLRGTPIDRFYENAFLEKHRADIAGHVLEVGDTRYSARLGAERVTRCDVLNFRPDPSATIVGDLSTPGLLPRDAFDCIVLTQVLQFVYDLPVAIAQLHAALKPGGVLLATAPGISKVDPPYPDGTWYWALTPAAASRIFEGGFGPDVAIESRGNVLAAISVLHGLTAEELPPDKLSDNDPAYPVVILIRARRA